jgi:S-adenosylmethionine decarboxylase proenzyme
MRQAAEAAGCVILYGQFHQFEPQGVTGLLLIAESHLSVHTWPEHGYAAVDLYTCGSAEPRQAIADLATALGATRTDWLTVERGLERVKPSLRPMQPSHASPVVL